MNLENLKALAAKLPGDYKKNATALIARMEEVVEGIGDEPQRWKAPNLKLVQGTTDRSSIPKGTAIGDFILGEAKVEQPFPFIPIRFWDGRQMWSPDQNESKLLCSSPDAKLGYIGAYCNACPHAKFDEVARKSECGKTKNILAIRSDLSDIFMAGFAKTNYKTGLELESAAKKAGVAPYKRVYALVSETNKQYKNVENYAVELLPDDKKNTPDTLTDFLKELFAIVNEDRKQNVEKFYEAVLAKKQSAALLDAPAESNTVLLTDDTPAAEAGESTVSELAKNYTV